MNWHGWQDFFAMGGYALYVWGSVLMTVVLLGAEVMVLRMRRTVLLHQATRRLRRPRKTANESKA